MNHSINDSHTRYPREGERWISSTGKRVVWIVKHQRRDDEFILQQEIGYRITRIVLRTNWPAELKHESEIHNG